LEEGKIKYLRVNRTLIGALESPIISERKRKKRRHFLRMKRKNIKKTRI
jgi:hypothetical protein